MKAFGSNFRNGGLYGNMIGCENLLYKIGFDMNDHYADLQENFMMFVKEESVMKSFLIFGNAKKN